MNRPLTIAILSLAIGGIHAAYLLTPSQLERVSMLERDGEIEAAAKLANTLYEAGDRRSPLLARVFELNHATGNAPRADEALRQYLAGTPDSPRTLRKAAEFFELEQNLEGTFTALVNLIRVAPSTASIEKLARLYRLHGRFAEEEKLLWTHRSVLDVDFVTRLGALLAQKGEIDAALGVLRVADQRFARDYEQFSSLLFDLLIRKDAKDEALERASRWASLDQDVYPRMPMILRFAETGADEKALKLASIVPAKPGSTAATPQAATVWTLLSRGYFTLAGDLLERFADTKAGRERREATTNYVTYAATAGMMPEIMTRTHRLLSADDDRQRRVGLSLTLAIVEKWGLSGLGALRGLVTDELAALDPFLAARIAFLEKQPAVAGFHLALVDLSEEDEGLSHSWARLAEQSFTPPQFARELARRRSEGSLPSVLMADLQIAMRKAGLFMPDFDPWAPQNVAARDARTP